MKTIIIFTHEKALKNCKFLDCPVPYTSTVKVKGKVHTRTGHEGPEGGVEV
jgi:hypothetical protein